MSKSVYNIGNIFRDLLIKHQINLLGKNIRAKPYDTSNKSRYFSLIKKLKKLIKQKKTQFKQKVFKNLETAYSEKTKNIGKF